MSADLGQDGYVIEVEYKKKRDKRSSMNDFCHFVLSSSSHASHLEFDQQT